MNWYAVAMKGGRVYKAQWAPSQAQGLEVSMSPEWADVRQVSDRVGVVLAKDLTMGVPVPESCVTVWALDFIDPPPTKTFYTVGRRISYEEMIIRGGYEAIGGSVWRRIEDAIPCSQSVTVEGKSVPGGVFEVEVPLPLEDSLDVGGHLFLTLKRPAKITRYIPPEEYANVSAFPEEKRPCTA